MNPNPPPSSGCTTSSTPPASVAANATPAEPQSADGWKRAGPDTIERDLYRIERSHVSRMLSEPRPVYHAYWGYAFLGVCATAEHAKYLCDEHARCQP